MAEIKGGKRTVGAHIRGMKVPKRPRDPNQLGKLIVDIATRQATEPTPTTDTPAVEFARSGGLKGGKARAKALSPERRSAIARMAAKKAGSLQKANRFWLSGRL
jgi:hypothetical protein